MERELIITVDTIPPTSPALSSPANNAVLRGTPGFSWKAISDGVMYQLQLADSPEFDSTPFTFPELTERSYVLLDSLSEGSYYWRVRSADTAGTGASGQIAAFTPLQFSRKFLQRQR